VVRYPPLCEMDVRQRRQFYEALLDADAFEDLPRSRRPQSWLNSPSRDCDTRGVGTSMTPRVLDSHASSTVAPLRMCPTNAAAGIHSPVFPRNAGSSCDAALRPVRHGLETVVPPFGGSSGWNPTPPLKPRSAISCQSCVHGERAARMGKRATGGEPGARLVCPSGSGDRCPLWGLGSVSHTSIVS
jgi:hypothetical protein